jgi:hypothetical protein
MSNPKGAARPGKALVPLFLALAALSLAALGAGGPARAGSDTDGDGFEDPVETFIGTDPLLPCNQTTTANDEPDAWPPDFNDDLTVNIVDVLPIRGAYGSTAPADRRYDLNADGQIAIADVLLVRNYYGATCEPPPPVTPPNVFAGQYYDNVDFTNLMMTRDDAAIDFNWGSGSPSPSMGANTFSIRWTGDFDFTAGNYVFQATVDDGVRIWVDGELEMDVWEDQPATTYSFNRTMTAGSHEIVVEYYENSGSASITVAWAEQAAPTPTPTPGPGPVEGSRIPWQGGEWYFHGANVPWYNWGCDFGCNNNGGASSSSVQNGLRQGFGQMEDAGMHVARWWVFPGGPWQINTNSSGMPTGINQAVYADFDAALALAEEYDLYYVFTLFSGPADLPDSWLTNASHRQALADVLGQLFARYANNPRVMTWQVYNEPEWAIWNNEVSESQTVELARLIALSVHANSNAYVSVGSAMLDGLGMWTGIGLDYYTAHWYDYMSSGGWCAMCTDYDEVQARFNLDAPLVIGEWYTTSGSSALSRFEAWYDKGYAGSLAWSLFWDHTYDQLKIDMNAATTFAGQHNDIGP